MFVSRFVLIVTLVLLQCIAPLVHAHTHEVLASSGVHLPELERYAKTPERQSVCHVESCHDDGMVVGVNTGVHRDMALPVQSVKTWLPDLPLALINHALVVPRPDVGFSVDVVFSFPIFNHRVDDFVHSPRAPPVLV